MRRPGLGRRRKIILFTACLLATLAATFIAALEERERRDRAQLPLRGKPDRIGDLHLEETDRGWLSLSFALEEKERSVAVEDAVLSVELYSWDGCRADREIARFETRVGAVHFATQRGDVRLAFDIPCHLDPIPSGTQGVEAHVKLTPAAGHVLEGVTRFVPVALLARKTR